MISLLAKLLIKNYRDYAQPAVRKAYGLLCGGVGIFLNILLFAGKLFAGTVSGSIAITADAFNNLSDAGSSVVTLLGFQLAGQKPDKDHPFGHGRIEYLSGLGVSVLILLMGLELAKSSLDKILHPQPVEFSALAVGILVASIATKGYMCLYNRSVGARIDSLAMKATAMDSLSDCVSTGAVLLVTVAGRFTDLPLDGWCGMLVALFILWTGVNAARDTISPLLGQPPTAEFVGQIESIVRSHKKIRGIHDLVVHDYGPGRVMISLHAEVSASENVMEIHDEIDNVERELGDKLHCEAVIHMDPVVTDDGVTQQTRDKMTQLIHLIDEGISIHDFRMVAGPTHTNVIFDAVVPFGFRMSDADVKKAICRAVEAMDGTYYAVVTVEHSYV